MGAELSALRRILIRNTVSETFVAAPSLFFTPFHSAEAVGADQYPYSALQERIVLAAEHSHVCAFRGFIRSGIGLRLDFSHSFPISRSVLHRFVSPLRSFSSPPPWFCAFHLPHGRTGCAFCACRCRLVAASAFSMARLHARHPGFSVVVPGPSPPGLFSRELRIRPLPGLIAPFSCLRTHSLFSNLLLISASCLSPRDAPIRACLHSAISRQRTSPPLIMVGTIRSVSRSRPG